MLLSTAAAHPAYAEPNAADRATAETLFQRGVELSRAGKHAEACGKFEASLSIEHAIGAALRLADCYDRLGRSASAWSLFEESLALANTQGDKARAHIARKRSTHLKQRLSILRLEVDEAVAELSPTITLNGTRLLSTNWEDSMPIDPGVVRVEVRAAGYKPWVSEVEIRKGPSFLHVAIPRQLEPTATTRAKRTIDPAQAVRTLGFASGGLGVAALVVAARFGISAQSRQRESREHCRSDDPNACTIRGVELREYARTRANAADIALGVGGAGLAAAVGLLVWGGGSTNPRPVAVEPALARGSAGVHFKGEF